MQERAREAVVVARVRRQLEEETGVALPEGRVVVGRKADGTNRQHLFELVGEGHSFVGEVRSYTLGEAGSRPAGKFAHCYAACLFLFRTRARRKVLVLTDHAFWSRFRRESEGLTEGIEILHIPIDASGLVMADEPPASAGDTPQRREERRPTDRPRGFSREDETPIARRNKGGPGPRGRRPTNGQRRGA